MFLILTFCFEILVSDSAVFFSPFLYLKVVSIIGHEEFLESRKSMDLLSDPLCLSVSLLIKGLRSLTLAGIIE